MSSPPVVMKTDYRDSDAGDLVRYIGERARLRSPGGRGLSDREIEAFVRESEQRGFERQMIFSASADASRELSGDDLEREVRRSLREFEEDRPTARYIYGRHEDTDHQHVHVALIGERRDLYMDRDDINRVRERTNDRVRDRTPELQRQHERDQERERERNRQRARSRAQDRSRGIRR
jgi:C4-dicarboxylate-specific signal transduction histidine kinase